ncbi:ferredoxin--NADP reductase [Aequorivita sp. SDUM287046]|uniref:Ferredoxin--NADP reductase n=1 Tax=Aequorivita aurantiaca TaxID=3053356 RepID=A0ABT8DGS6_9FLAO|nr:ferredoxin--NADP reductase [Aequorivita aurantiaca]MDN3723124.1 ferredoxin--NADP reductase [Aequorivita aurantiaca]
MSEFHTLTVSEVKSETPNSVSISFDLPENLKNTFAFKAGQYITIKYLDGGKEIRRAYSICSSPKSGILKVGVKKVDKGAFSMYANNQLKAGDTLRVMPPTGKFILEPNLKNYAAFAAGSGITPVLSLIKSTLEDMPQSKFLLVYGNQNIAETMFYNDILELQKQFPKRFFAEFVFSRKEEENARFGRIDRAMVNFFLKNKYAETTFEAFYLCGPEEMIDEVSATLKHNGINSKQVHHELFSTAEKGLLVEKHDGNTTVRVILDNDEETFEMPQTKSILEAALDEGLDPPYSCQGGICSTCIARLKEGKAEMRKNQILTEAEIADGLILTCQAHPTTPTVVVDYDDV